MKKFGAYVGWAIGAVGAGVMTAAGWRLEGYLHDKIKEFIDTHEISLKKKKVGPYAVE